jgi:hypothetical protein
MSFSRGVGLLTDFLWFKSLNLESVFMVKILTKLILFLPVWLFFGSILTVYFKELYAHFIKHSDGNKPIISNKRLYKYTLFFGFSIGALLSFIVVNLLWMDYLKFANAASFEQSDPLFNLNISFYMFALPLLKAVLQILLLFVGVLIVGIAAAEVMTFKNTASDSIPMFQYKDLNATFLLELLKKVRWLALPFFILLGSMFYLHTYDLLYSTRGVAYGASYTDVTITLLAYRIYAVLALACGVLTLVASYKNKIKFFILGPLLLVTVAIVFFLTGEFVQKLIVEPDEISKESKYLSYNIEYTQEAFNLSKVALLEFPYTENLTLDVIENNAETIRNIRINDERPLKQTFNQIQSIRLYYDFQDIDVDRYYLDGAYTQVFVSARELDQYKLDNKAMTWLNQFLKYTHGYGIVMSPVNMVTEEGQPVLLFKNIPPVSSTNLSIDKPEIYFGEITNNYIVVNTDEKEFDYPSGSDNVETLYSGDSGIPLTSFNKLLFALREKSMKLFVSNNISEDSRIIIRRNIMQRVQVIAPFLTYDDDPYIVLNEDDGKLYWIIDAYTISSHYPYSQVFDFKGKDVNYIRNSVKVVIDAYEGDTDFYIYDDQDPIIQTYSFIYPKLFKSKEDFPSGLVAHTRYPKQYFDLQANAYQKYHVDNPVVFYNGEDVWDIATEKYMADVQTVQSNYVMFKIEDLAEFALILPYTPKGKPNMTSLLVARNDGEHYGEIFIYRFPKDKTIQGPIMIESRIDQDSVISPQFTLWGQEGSTILRGNVIVVPIENSLLYVEPIYIQSDNENSLPEMKRVIIAYADKIVMEQTLQAGLDRLFGKEVPVDTLEQTLRELLDKIGEKFDMTQESLNELELLIKALEEKVKE